MDSHFIPVHDGSGIWTDNYERFLRQRAELLVAEIKRLTAMPDTLLPEHRNPVLDEIESALRDTIHDALNAAHGWDYWQECVPKDVQVRTQRRIDAEVKRNPGVSKGDFDNPRARLDFCDVADYEKIVLSNWHQFSNIFRSKSEVERNFRDFAEFRNATKHNREIDGILEYSAQAAIIWMAKALDLDLSHYDVLIQ